KGQDRRSLAAPRTQLHSSHHRTRRVRVIATAIGPEVLSCVSHVKSSYPGLVLLAIRPDARLSAGRSELSSHPRYRERAQMADRPPYRARSSFLSIKAALHLSAVAAAAIGLWTGSPTASSFAEGAGATEPEEEPAEWVAKSEELASIPINRIIKSIR